MKRQITVAVIGGLLAGPAAHAEEPVAEVSALVSGNLLLNGQLSDVATIEAAFKALKEKNGVVWYYRESAQTEPPPAAMAVIKLIVKYGLPVSLSSKPDFSDYVDENGNSKPREP